MGNVNFSRETFQFYADVTKDFFLISSEHIEAKLSRKNSRKNNEKRLRLTWKHNNTIQVTFPFSTTFAEKKSVTGICNILLTQNIENYLFAEGIDFLLNSMRMH